MKGYVVENGYMGYLDGKYVLFADESDYKRYGSCSAGTPPGNHETSLNFWSACGII